MVPPNIQSLKATTTPTHEQTYRNFIALVKWVGGFVVLIVAGMAYFLT
jgi:Bacterial aa3 type cytochrome c oxidase subunit IV.